MPATSSKVVSLASCTVPLARRVTVAIAGGAEIVSVITESSARDLALKEGQEVYAVIKASSVMIATD